MRKTVMIVDDSRFARLTLRSIIATSFPDYFIGEAANGDEAFSMLKEIDAEYMLIDHNMPGEDGLTIAARLRQSHPRIKVALVTANVQDAIVKKARSLGLSFVGKPIVPAAVLAFLNGD